MIFPRIKMQNYKQQKIRKRFVKLCRMQRHSFYSKRMLVCEYYRPWNTARFTVTTADRKTAQSPYSMSQCQSRSKKISQSEDHYLFLSCVHIYTNQSADKTAIINKTTLPHLENIQRRQNKFVQIYKDKKKSCSYYGRNNYI